MLFYIYSHHHFIKIEYEYEPEGTLEEGLEPYKTVRSGSCKVVGMNMVSSEDECRRIVANLKMFWFPDYRIPHQPIRKEGSLLFPFGCVYASNKQFYWNPPVGIQESVPCGSSWGGEKYYCICSKYRKLYKKFPDGTYVSKFSK